LFGRKIERGEIRVIIFVDHASQNSFLLGSDHVLHFFVLEHFAKWIRSFGVGLDTVCESLRDLSDFFGFGDCFNLGVAQAGFKSRGPFLVLSDVGFRIYQFFAKSGSFRLGFGGFLILGEIKAAEHQRGQQQDSDDDVFHSSGLGGQFFKKGDRAIIHSSRTLTPLWLPILQPESHRCHYKIEVELSNSGFSYLRNPSVAWAASRACSGVGH
jgi:hypothetical protein